MRVSFLKLSSNVILYQGNVIPREVDWLKTYSDRLPPKCPRHLPEESNKPLRKLTNSCTRAFGTRQEL